MIQDAIKKTVFNKEWQYNNKFKKDLLVFLFLFVIVLWIGLKLTILQGFGKNFDSFPGDFADVRFINCILEHNWQWLKGNIDNYWDANFMYPEKKVITYSDNLLGNLPIYAIFRVFEFSVHHSLQGWLLVTVCLNFIFGFFSFYYFLKDKYLALLATFIFTFSLALISQYVHIQMSARYMIPLFFMYLVRALNEKRPLYLFYTGLSLTFQFYLSIYLGFLLLYSGMCFFVVYILFNNVQIRKLTNRDFLQIALGIFVNAVLLGILLFPYIERSDATRYVPYSSIIPTIPTLGSYLRPFYGTEFWPFRDLGLNSNPVTWMHVLFPGGLVVLAVVISPITGIIFKDKFFGVLILITTLILISFLQVNGYSFMEWINKIPGFASIRIGTRIINILIFFFALLTALTLKLWTSKINKNYVGLIAFLFLIFSFFDQRNDWSEYTKTKIKLSNIRVKGIVKEVKSKFDISKHKVFVVIMEQPDPVRFNNYQVDAMLASYRLNIKTINAYTSFANLPFQRFWGNPTLQYLYDYLNEYKINPEEVLILKR